MGSQSRNLYQDMSDHAHETEKGYIKLHFGGTTEPRLTTLQNCVDTLVQVDRHSTFARTFSLAQH